jgi:hypothetical protein
VATRSPAMTRARHPRLELGAGLGAVGRIGVYDRAGNSRGNCGLPATPFCASAPPVEDWQSSIDNRPGFRPAENEAALVEAASRLRPVRGSSDPVAGGDRGDHFGDHSEGK